MNSPAGPMRDVVYIFESEGDRGGAFWFLVLACGHRVARKRYVPSPATATLMFRPLAEKLAPRRARCCFCEMGCAERDPWSTIEAMGGPSAHNKSSG